ncbi:MAG: gliding motility-associated C-terminal domain-containing protein, partial [Bacteroidetes bacterium]|nr:gliding motility-associated C-terminal domain-containing protein [Bacteroidota bacterium]
HSNLYDPLVDGPGTYTYTIAGIAPCGAAQSMVVVQETGTPNAGGDGTVTLCSTSGATDLFNALVGADVGGTWTAPGGAAHSNLLDPLVDAAGVYVYTIAAVAPCAGDQSQVTVAINAAPDAGADGATTVCDQGAAIDLFNELTGADAGGTWTAPGGAAHSNLYDPSVDGPGTYTYTVAGMAPCGAAQSVVVVQETNTPNAGVDGAITLCSAGIVVDLFGQLGGTPDAGGTWTAPGGAAHGSTLDPATDAAGTYTYTIAAAAPCVTASAIVAVSIDPAHDAGTNGTISVCTGDAPFALVDHLGGTPDAGGGWTGPGGAASSGTFDPATSAPGVYSYLLSGNSCPDALSSVTVAVLSGPNAGQDNSVAFCSSDATVDLIDQLLGAPGEGGTWTGPDGLSAGATFDPATSVAGTYTYTIPGNAACPAATADVNITVSEAVSAGTIGISTLCSTGTVVDLFEALNGSPDPGGTWTDPHQAPFDGTYDPATDEPGVYTYTVAAAAPCPTTSAGITVEVNTAPDAGTSTTAALCADNAPVGLSTLLGGTPDAGGTWTAPEGAPFDGLFDPATTAPGIYTYQVVGIVPCAADQATVTVGVAQPADTGGDGAVSLCSNAAPFALLSLLTGTPDPGGAWTAPDGTPSTPTLDPATAASGAYVYTVTPPAPCSQAIAVVQVDIITVPVVEPTFTMTTGCAPVEVTFASGYAGAGACHWDFGNDSTSVDCGPVTMLYTEPGTYAVTFTADPGNGCATVVTLGQQVNVYPPPTAAFGIVATGIHTQDPIAAFDNQSTGALSYLWRFGDVGTSTAEDPQFTFPYDVEATYPVCLIAYAAPTCADTLCQDLFVPAGSSVFTPNAFTPDGDGINDGFAPNTRALNAEEYHFYIFDRWGQPLYDTQDPNAHWDGRSRNGMEVPEGVYVWKLMAMDAVTGERFEDIGHVSLVR